MNNFLYVFVRKDLRPSQVVVQSIHSAFDLGLKTEGGNSPSVVLIGAKDEQELKKQLDFVGHTGLPFKEFIEPYYNNSLTSFAVGPVSSDQQVL